jgi:hypothetical protein
VYLEIDVYSTQENTGMVSDAQVDLGGADFSNQAIAGVTPGDCYSLSAVNFQFSGESFSQWVYSAVTGGTISVSNAFASPTTFCTTTSYSGGTLSLVVNLGTGPWGGYEQSGTSITAAMATFTVPTSSYVTYNGQSGLEEEALIWVGIGGDQTSGNLWQAGLDLVYHVGACSTFCVSPWYECTSTQGIQYNLNIHATVGDSVTVEVWTNNGAGFYLIYDNTLSKTIETNQNTAGDPCSPDVHTAEWVVEPNQPEVMPNYGSVSFVNPDVTDNGAASSSFCVPLGKDLGIESQSNPTLIQHSSPAGVNSNIEKFTVSYSQTT